MPRLLCHKRAVTAKAVPEMKTPGKTGGQQMRHALSDCAYEVIERNVGPGGDKRLLPPTRAKRSGSDGRYVDLGARLGGFVRGEAFYVVVVQRLLLRRVHGGVGELVETRGEVPDRHRGRRPA